MNKPGTPAGLGGRADLASLADELVRAFVVSGKSKPVLPTGRREELVSALTQMMVDGETLDAFVGELERARTAHGVHLALFKQLTSDLPDEVIARGGFGVLSDEQLADIAIDPSALHALSDYLWCELDPDSELPEPEWGDWWWKAVSSGEPAQPGLARSVVANTGGESVPAPKEEQIIPFDPARTTSRPRAPRWLGRAAAIAASLLLGVFLGRTAFDGGGEGNAGYPLASASPVYGPGRGTERDLGVRFESGLRGFATVIALSPGNRPEVFPALGRDDVPVQASVPTEFSPLPSETKEAIVVVTETPAADPVRRALRDRSGETGDASSLLTFLEPHLRTKGYRRISIGIIRFDSE
jgi:hypothetical protein